MTKIFISFSNLDGNLHKEIREKLADEEIPSWDHEEMVPGEQLAPQLREAILACPLCVFLATENSVSSPWCLAEVGAFWGAGKQVIVLEEQLNFDERILPPQFRGSLRAHNRDSLVEAIRHHLPKEPAPPERVPAVLLHLSDDSRDVDKCEVLINSLGALELSGQPFIKTLDSLDSLSTYQLRSWDGLLLGVPYRQHLNHKLIFNLVSWVRAGGRLVMTGFELGERHHGTNINQLAWHFGIHFNSDVIIAPKRNFNPNDKQYDDHIRFTTLAGTDHPMMNGVNHVTMRNVCSLHLEPGAIPLMLASPNKILELEGSAALYSHQGDGTFLLAAGAQKFRDPFVDARRAVIAEASRGLTGKGRVLALGSWDFRADSAGTDNVPFLSNLWRWFTD